MDDPLAERQELYRVHDWLASSNLTGLLTARLDPDNMPLPTGSTTLYNS